MIIRKGKNLLEDNKKGMRLKSCGLSVMDFYVNLPIKANN